MVMPTKLGGECCYFQHALDQAGADLKHLPATYAKVRAQKIGIRTILIQVSAIFVPLILWFCQSNVCWGQKPGWSI